MNTYLLTKPVVTEKSLGLANRQNVYTFEVSKDANKHQIAEAVKTVYGVEVEAVKTIFSAKSTKKTGRKRLTVTVPKLKKALVKLKSGQTIKVFDLGGEKN